jgi:hypothetical protein|tara:strand:- start:281 stop:871 length:591 start_codon:yes stop_codon:yes gene_type:complete
MANAFDSDNFKTVEPEVLTIGDRWVWKRTDLGSDYPPSSYALSYDARLQGTGSTAISITASESGDDYLVEVASATTAAYTAGSYSWAAYITRSSDSQRIQIDSGEWVTKTNLAADTSDPRDHDEKMLDYLETTLESLAQKLTTSYSISDRSNTLQSMSEVREQLDDYRGRVRSKTNKARVLSGQRTDMNLLLRFPG